MKKHIKRVICIITAIVIMAISCVPSFAKTAENKTEKPIAKLSLCSCIYVWPIAGHTWIYVENTSKKPIKVGLYEVPAGQGVSIGSFAFTSYDGWGLYYNVEATRENRSGYWVNHWSKTMDMTASDLEKLNESLRKYPNYWGVVANCATFAFSMWNSVSGDSFFSLLIPAISQAEVIIGGGKRGALQMYEPKRNQVFKQRGMGDSAYLDPVSNLTYYS